MSNLNDLYSLAIKLRSKIVSAESCTAGLLAASLTELPGSSVFYEQGYITYSNHSKTRVLGVFIINLRLFYYDLLVLASLLHNIFY